MLRWYLADMPALGCAVRCIQSDRGTEYFSLEHATLAYRERALHEFGKVCDDANIRHVLRPIEFKEKLAEAYFKENFRLATIFCGLGACLLVLGLIVSLTPLICGTDVETRTLDMRQHLGLLQLVRFLAETRSRYLVLSVLSTFSTTKFIKCLAFLVDVTLFLWGLIATWMVGNVLVPKLEVISLQYCLPVFPRGFLDSC